MDIIRDNWFFITIVLVCLLVWLGRRRRNRELDQLARFNQNAEWLRGLAIERASAVEEVKPAKGFVTFKTETGELWLHTTIINKEGEVFTAKEAELLAKTMKLPLEVA